MKLVYNLLTQMMIVLMTRNLIFGILIIITFELFGQNDSIIYNEKGEIKEKGKIVNGLKSGLWIEYYTDNENKGLIKRKFYYSKGVYFKAEAYYGIKCNNRLSGIGNYKEVKGYSVNHGKKTTYYCSGKVDRKALYKNDNLICSKSFYENGNVENIQSKVIGSNNRRGKWVRGYENGIIKEVGKFNNDLKIGIWKYYYENGQIKSKGKYIPKEKRIPDVRTREELVNLKLLPDLDAVEDSLITLGYEITHNMLPVRVFFKTGKWKYWDEKGNIIREQEWKKGDLIEDKKWVNFQKAQIEQQEHE